MRIIPEWIDLDNEIKAIEKEFIIQQQNQNKNQQQNQPQNQKLRQTIETFSKEVI